MRYLVLLGALLGLVAAQSAEIEKGKTLFQQRCAACHKLEQKLIGPPLARVSERRSQEWFLRFVANSQAVIQSGDAQAVAVYKEYNQQIMPPFPDLSEADIQAIWAYVNAVEAPKPPTEAGAALTAKEPSAVLYPGEARPMAKEDFAFLRHTFWLLVIAAVFVALLLALGIHLLSLKRASEQP